VSDLRSNHGRNFRDEEHRDTLLFIDNIFRYVQAGLEVSALLGRMPSAVGYQPTLASEMGMLQERITTTYNGSITSIQAVYVPADDYTDPAPATTFQHLDASTVLHVKLHRLDFSLPSILLNQPQKGLNLVLLDSVTTMLRAPFSRCSRISRASGYHRHSWYG